MELPKLKLYFPHNSVCRFVHQDFYKIPEFVMPQGNSLNMNYCGLIRNVDINAGVKGNRRKSA